MCKNMNKNTNEREVLLKRIQELEFAMVDLGLYLDSHPCNTEAISEFDDLKCEHEKLKAEYEKCYGPLTITGNNDCNYWSWVATPWPWEA